MPFGGIKTGYSMDITKLDTQELKALAYDEILKIERAQVNLKLINEEINKKLTQSPEIQEK